MGVGVAAFSWHPQPFQKLPLAIQVGNLWTVNKVLDEEY
jgi:hypothetical protein